MILAVCEAELVEARLSWELLLLHHTGQLLLQLVSGPQGLPFPCFFLAKLEEQWRGRGWSAAAHRCLQAPPWLSPPAPTCTLQFSHWQRLHGSLRMKTGCVQANNQLPHMEQLSGSFQQIFLFLRSGLKLTYKNIFLRPNADVMHTCGCISSCNGPIWLLAPTSGITSKILHL